MKNKIRDFILKMFPNKFKKHYIIPFFTKGRFKESMNSKEFFESYHDIVFKTGHSDQITISQNASALLSKFHYNTVENSIIKYIHAHPIISQPVILDVGSGAGHWIDFYSKLFSPKLIVGNEISEVASIALENKYLSDDNIKIVAQDISKKDLKLEHKFDVINAIGIMFHIVEDHQWEQAIVNFKNHLTETGVLIIGGQFGFLTRNVEFSNSNRFDENGNSKKWDKKKLYVNKRIRSLKYWKKVAKRNGLVVSKLIKTQQDNGIHTPENNILVLRKN